MKQLSPYFSSSFFFLFVITENGRRVTSLNVSKAVSQQQPADRASKKKKK
jgi:hypothetical protein